MRRSIPLFFLLILWMGLFLQVGQSTSFSSVEVYYQITGEKCYEGGVYAAGYAVGGTMRIKLTAQTASTVAYEFSYFLMKVVEEHVIDEGAEAGVLTSRMNPDGNFTCFFIDMPCPATQRLGTLTETVEAHSGGERFVMIAGHYVRTHYFCYTIQDPLSVSLRYEWYFAWDTGVLLQFTKSIEVNLVRVQWVDYKITNSTLALAGSHPITAFFTNIRPEFFAGVGAIFVVAILFLYLVQKKAKRGGEP
jgi:hypothetical protein